MKHACYTMEKCASTYIFANLKKCIQRIYYIDIKYTPVSSGSKTLTTFIPLYTNYDYWGRLSINKDLILHSSSYNALLCPQNIFTTVLDLQTDTLSYLCQIPYVWLIWCSKLALWLAWYSIALAMWMTRVWLLWNTSHNKRPQRRIEARFGCTFMRIPWCMCVHSSACKQATAHLYARMLAQISSTSRMCREVIIKSLFSFSLHTESILVAS